MNKEKFNFLIGKVEELTKEDIISYDQGERAKSYFSNSKKESASIVTIFTAIGILLVALSMITIFAFNWDNLSREIKVILAFIPLVITAVMLYITMKKDTSKLKTYTSIFAPIAIVATNSLVSQIFHIQTEIFEMMFFCIIMFLPIATILRNTTSIVVYGIFATLYTISIYNIPENIIYSVILALPLIGYNVYNYINNRLDKKNIIMWVINLFIVTILLFNQSGQITLLRPEVIIIYIYTVYLMTKKLFGDKNILTELFNICLIGTFLILSISEYFVSFAEELKFGLDTLILSLGVAALIYNLKMYKNIRDMILFAGIFLLQYTRMESEILFVLVNLLLIVLGIYYIILGNKKRSHGTSIGGVAIILFLILVRFMNSDMDFIQKSMMFLATGVVFIVIANITKKKLGGN